VLRGAWISSGAGRRGCHVTGLGLKSQNDAPVLAQRGHCDLDPPINLCACSTQNGGPGDSEMAQGGQLSQKIVEAPHPDALWGLRPGVVKSPPCCAKISQRPKQGKLAFSGRRFKSPFFCG
jgi:hypothetical protein